MSTNRRKNDFAAINSPLSMKELTQVLVKHYGLPEGKYDLGIEFHIGTGPVGPSSEELVPGVILGVKSIGLSPSKEGGSTGNNVAEAAAIEPTRQTPAKKGRAKKSE